VATGHDRAAWRFASTTNPKQIRMAVDMVEHSVEGIGISDLATAKIPFDCITTALDLTPWGTRRREQQGICDA